MPILREATVVRFLVAYISADGLDAVGRDDLLRILQNNEDSFRS